jgi:toxin ParE1/3/4
MSLKLTHYELSLAADKDLEDVFDYTVDKFGVDQAVKYVFEFDEKFTMLIKNPALGRSRPEIKKGLRSLSKDSHQIFYHVLKNHIRIVRVLHGSLDLSQFSEQK